MLSSTDPRRVALTLYRTLPRPGEEFIGPDAWNLVAVFASTYLNGELYTYPGHPKHPDHAFWRKVYTVAISYHAKALRLRLATKDNTTSRVVLAAAIQGPGDLDLGAELDSLADEVNHG